MGTGKSPEAHRPVSLKCAAGQNKKQAVEPSGRQGHAAPKVFSTLHMYTHIYTHRDMRMHAHHTYTELTVMMVM